MIKKGAIVIDVGITRTIDPVSSKTKLIGDVHFDGMSHSNFNLNFLFSKFMTVLFYFIEVSSIAKFITPVPGGVGPVTVAMLLKNVFLAAQQRKLRK